MGPSHNNDPSPSKSSKLQNNLYQTTEEIEVLHPTANTVNSDLIIRILSETGEPRCLVPLNKSKIIPKIPIFEDNQQNESSEVSITVFGLEQLSNIREFFAAIESDTKIQVRFDNCFDIYRIAKAFDCTETYGADAENHIRSHISLETILETNSLGREFLDDCKKYLEGVKKQLAKKDQNNSQNFAQNSQNFAQNSQNFAQNGQSWNQTNNNQNNQSNQKTGPNGHFQQSFGQATQFQTPNFNKTRICMYFMQGTCDKTAEQCSYAHGPDDLNQENRNNNENIGNGQNFAQNNQNFGKNNNFGQNNNKPRLCNQFMQQG